MHFFNNAFYQISMLIISKVTIGPDDVEIELGIPPILSEMDFGELLLVIESCHFCAGTEMAEGEK